MNKKVIQFFIVTLLISWLLWLPTVIHSNVQKLPGILLLIGMFAGFAPSIIGLLFMKKEKGTDFKTTLKNKISKNFSIKYILLMLVFPLQAGFTLWLVKTLQSDFVVKNPISPAFYPIVFLQILFIGGALGEEFGWRGFAQEKLEASHGILLGTLILGLVWSLWHLPLFFMENTVQSHLPIYQFMLQNTLLAFFYTWFYHKTKGNMITMILLHAIMNTSSAIFPYWQSELGRFIGLGLLVITLIIMYYKDRKTLLKRA